MADAVQWAQCDLCEKWRVVQDSESLPEIWYCEMNVDPMYRNCQVPEQQVLVTSPVSPNAESIPVQTGLSAPVAQTPAAGLGPGSNASSKRLTAKPTLPENEVAAYLKNLPTDKLRELWLSFDWAALVDARKPAKPPKQRAVGGLNVDDRPFVRTIDAAVRKSLPKGLAAQTPPLVSLYEQYQALLEQLQKEDN